MHNEKILIEAVEMKTIIERMTFQIIESSPNLEDVCLVGIRRRGVNIAERIMDSFKKFNKAGVKFGTLDITLYRDDLTEVASMPQFKSTNIDFDIQDKVVILVDDVLFTGRTIRAAIEAILDYGRPKKIMLAVMVDRGHRELPIEANFIGKTIQTALREVIHVKVKELDNEEDKVTVAIREVL